MLDPSRAQAASALLLDHWRQGRRLPALPPDLRPATRGEGYAIQACLEAPGAAPLFGWKIAATSTAGQRHIGVDGPMAGRLPADRVLADGAAVSLAGNLMRVAEVEFAFRMGRTLPPREASYDVDAVMGAVAGLHLAIEIPDSRFEDFATVGAPQLIADDACAHLFVLGPEVTADWRVLDLSRERPVGHVGRRYSREGLGANVLGDPRLALTWLANELSGIGVPLAAGQVVTTGTCLAPLEIAPDDAVLGDFGALGRVSVRFTD
ncbi:2-keto-4-pentenoate hydratase [Stella humosa]|uniref:2-keto-4-pentenoate hydratase n=1 Tax=Stella humosa TaxID=94 RepID=A0A3N1KHS9_9PROT|nr:fumarylacetoacetate hydrolase family protein [Stella humosa]ROP81133.1 2-keto-4-pentenoate hydratase [Stella humosa]BBK32478.1 fumarylacetoacetate (FAA) hydrolase [Stella humosa]